MLDKVIAKANLFLNRASEWVDIDSHLPDEGKVKRFVADKLIPLGVF